MFIDYTLYICTVNSYYVFGHRSIDKKLHVLIDREYATVFSIYAVVVTLCFSFSVFLYLCEFVFIEHLCMNEECMYNFPSCKLYQSKIVFQDNSKLNLH